MKEIEVKAHVSDLNTLVQKLTDLGCVFADPIHQIDTVFVKNLGSREVYESNDHFLRIREVSNGKKIFTFKQPLQRGTLMKTEHETEISNAEEFEKALLMMGYFASNIVKKERKIAHYKEYEICLDVVEELGSFIEIEKLSADDPESVRRELFDFLMTLGISPENETKKGYDIQMIEKIYAIQ